MNIVETLVFIKQNKKTFNHLITESAIFLKENVLEDLSSLGEKAEEVRNGDPVKAGLSIILPNSTRNFNRFLRQLKKKDL
jgi:ABC-type metal ion transport system substrate-binding protein